MEPTILKTPRIYKGAGIYKYGAEGGGGGFKDFLLTQKSNTHPLNDGWVINGGSASTSGYNVGYSAVCKKDVDISNANVLEIEFSFEANSGSFNFFFFSDRISSTGNIAIGWLSSYYTFGIFDWNTNQNVYFGGFPISANTKYKVKYKFDFSAQTLEQYRDGELLQTDSISGYELHKTTFAPTWGHRGTNYDLLPSGITLYLDEVVIKADNVVIFRGAA